MDGAGDIDTGFGPGAIAALRTLAALHHTSVAVISGRSLRDLALMSRLPSEVHLVGSHGSEAVATPWWVPSTRWTRVEPLRGSESSRIGVVATAAPV